MIEQITISDLEHDQFVKDHPNGDMCQLSSWARVKGAFGWDYSRIAVGRGQEITGVASLLFKKVPVINSTMCYVSRGFIVDWFDEESVKALLEAVIEEAKKHKAFVIKIDPDLKEDTPDLLEKIESYGFKHQGFTFGFKDANQPRFHMVTDIDMDEKALMKSYQNRTRSQVRKSLKYGLVLEDAPLEKMAIFHDIMEETGERDNFMIRDLDYFKKIYTEMNPTGDAKLFLVKVNPQEALKGLETDLKNRLKEQKNLSKKEQTEGIKEQLSQIDNAISNAQEEIAEMEELAEQHPEGIYLSGSIYTQSGPKAYYLYGASSDSYRYLMPNYFMQWEMMKYAQDQGCTSYDFGGVSGLDGQPEDDSPGLFEFKKRWGANKRARIGEFDYILKPSHDRLFRLAFEIRKHLLILRKKLAR